MSLSMFLELEYGATIAGVREVLRGFPVEFRDHTEVSGVFLNSYCHFVVKEVEGVRGVVAEGVHADWNVGIVAGFHYRAENIDASWLDVVDFMIKYSEVTDLRFVLSFHYENVYAVRDDRGLRIMRSLALDE